MPTFLHAADLHIDSPLRGLERREGAPAQRIREASRVAMSRMVDAAIERRVAFVLLAGDIYDTQPVFETYLFFHGEMERLSRAGIPVAIVLGNHDHAGASPRAERLPERVYVFPADRPTSIELVPGVWVHGRSYPTRDIATDLTIDYPAPVPGALNIGLLHTALDGHSGEHARYAPSSTQALAGQGYAYWALGHVHAPLDLCVRGCRIVYPGNLQGRHARETGPKGAMFVDFERAAISSVRHEAFDDVRWHRLEVDPSSLEAERDPVRQLAEQVRSTTEACRRDGRLAAVRVRVSGVAPNGLLSLGEDEIRETLRSQFHSDDAVFLEKIELDLRPAAHSSHELDHYLERLVLDMGADDQVKASLAQELQDLVSELRAAGGRELADAYRTSLGSTEARADLAAALPWVREALLGTSRGGR